MHIIRYHDSRYNEVVDFITRLNGDPVHQIGYLGASREEVIHDLGELSVALPESFWLAEEDDEVVGLLGYDADETLGRIWLMGPFVDRTDWQLTADRLYAELGRSIPAARCQHELFGHLENKNLAHFALVHGFDALPETYLLRLERSQYPHTLPEGLSEFTVTLTDQFVELHSIVFPNTYYTAEQLIAMCDDHHKLLVAVTDERLQGYAFVKIMPDIQQAYLDFIGVATDARRQGVGRRLLSGVMYYAFLDPTIRWLDLTVNGDNAAANRMYGALGFEAVQSLRGYRRPRDYDQKTETDGSQPNVVAPTPGSSK